MTLNSSSMTIMTIGVYGSTEQSFYSTLVENHVEVFCDIRSRRGMRGSQYAYVNSKYLQQRLAQLGIEYHHFKILAPSEKIREQQRALDHAQRIGKRERIGLGEEFENSYKREILPNLNVQEFFSQFNLNISRLCFFCVEAEPQACHRSIVAEYLASQPNLSVVHLYPQITSKQLEDAHSNHFQDKDVR